MHPEDKIDHILIPELKLAFLTDNRWHPVHLPSVQAVRCTRFLDRENLAAYRARLRFNERAAAARRIARALYFDYSIQDDFYPQFNANTQALWPLLDKML